MKPIKPTYQRKFGLLFGVEVAPTIEDGVGSHILPTYAWTKCIIFDILSPTIEDISQVVIFNPWNALSSEDAVPR